MKSANPATIKSWALAGVGALAIAAVAVAGAFGAPARVANAQDMPAVSQVLPRTITVVGEGRVRVDPDIARINIGVEVMRPTVREASDANQELVDSVLGALTDAGIPEEDLQTSGYSVYAERYGPNGPLPEDQTNYRVTNTVNVTVRDLETVGEVIDAAIEAGANNIYGIEFAVDDTTSYNSEARAAAVEDARARAAELAELTGVELGGVVSVSEVIGTVSPFNNFRADALAMGSGGTSIQPGQVSMTMQLQIVFEIAQ
jgi:uncharacterized protein YggE